MQALFSDDIHPNQIGRCGLACLALTCMYHTDLRPLRLLHAQAAHSPQVREYFTPIAWDIATMDDPLPNRSPDDKIR
jgi:hypothetical protein